MSNSFFRRPRFGPPLRNKAQMLAACGDRHAEAMQPDRDHSVVMDERDLALHGDNSPSDSFAAICCPPPRDHFH